MQTKKVFFLAMIIRRIMPVWNCTWANIYSILTLTWILNIPIVCSLNIRWKKCMAFLRWFLFMTIRKNRVLVWRILTDCLIIATWWRIIIMRKLQTRNIIRAVILPLQWILQIGWALKPAILIAVSMRDRLITPRHIPQTLKQNAIIPIIVKQQLIGKNRFSIMF